ncbi:MAG TPA: CmcI family methyltransferase [Methanocorpusculum sp.]|nr:CmcI family methyltransferase [Methanocorpusculum sp.]
MENHPMYKRIIMFEGDSTSKEIADKVYAIAEKHKKIMVCLDSNHTHEHVLKELELYAPLVSKGSYCVVFDTVIEDWSEEVCNIRCSDRPWGKGNNPKTAVNEFLKNHDEFAADERIENKLLITAAPGGFLKRVK